MTERTDFCLAWEWECDRDFAAIVERECRGRGIGLEVIHPGTLAGVLPRVLSGELSFGMFFDRASDTNAAFLPLAEHLARGGVRFVNPPAQVERAINKAVMHLEFIAHGIGVPYTIILPVYEKDPTDRILKVEDVGLPFIIKPAHGGGGEGVLLGAKTIDEIMEARRDFRHDQILIQETIVPRTIGGRRAWFRVYWTGGDIRACWWDPHVHLYERLRPGDIPGDGFDEMRRIATTIHALSGLEFFSTEITIAESGKFISVDYVNDQCDMRLQSGTWDGVPDDIVEGIAASLAGYIKKCQTL